MMNLLFVTAFYVVADSSVSAHAIAIQRDNDINKAIGAFLIAGSSLLISLMGFLYWYFQPEDRNRSKISKKVQTDATPKKVDTTTDVVATAAVAAVAAGTLTLVALFSLQWYFQPNSVDTSKAIGAFLIAGSSLLLAAVGFRVWNYQSGQKSPKRFHDRRTISKKVPTGANANDNVDKGVVSVENIEKFLSDASSGLSNSSGSLVMLMVCGSVLVLLIVVWGCIRCRKIPAEKE
jgi:hypothetical protein